MDRDSNFSSAFRTILKDAGVEPVRLPARSPNLNSHLERFHLSIKSECLEDDLLRREVAASRRTHSFSIITTANAIIKGWTTRSSSPG